MAWVRNLSLGTLPSASLYPAGLPLESARDRTLRSDHNVTRNGVEQKVSLYADDLLLCISNISVSAPAVLRTFSLFSCISGYKIVLEK